MKAEFILMGCSVSSGVPALGNDWGACDPDEPKNRRNRPCAILKTDETTLVIDTGPDFRSQMNELNLGTCDAVLYTHAHSDHILGIDELRIVRHRKGALVDIYGNRETIKTLCSRFDYMFEDKTHYARVLHPHIIEQEKLYRPIEIHGVNIVPFHQDHGDCACLGFRFGSLGYSVDMHDLTQDSVDVLRGVDVWVADGAGHHIEDHKTHAPLSRLYKLNEQIGAKTVYVIGLSKFMDYQTLKDELPKGFEPAYDGLRIPVFLNKANT